MIIRALLFPKQLQLIRMIKNNNNKKIKIFLNLFFFFSLSYNLNFCVFARKDNEELLTFVRESLTPDSTGFPDTPRCS